VSEKVLDGYLATKFGCIPADKPNFAAIGSTPINSTPVTGCVGLKVPFLSPLTILLSRANRSFPALQREISTSL
jgi:hypothetical protein